jgi:uncharacterized membrane protein YccC
MPAMFAFGDRVIGDTMVATFAAFGCFAMLILVDFGGEMRDRLQAQAALGLTCGALICLGTLASRTTWVAAVAMAAVAFAVLFAGVVSSTLAGATTSLLLAFILPVSLPAPPSAIPERLAGWGMAAAASLLAISLLWPAPARNPLRTAAIEACRALGERLRSEVAFIRSGASAEHDAAVARAGQAVDALQQVFFATPYRPTGLSTAARAVIRLVDELRWLNDIIVQAAPRRHATAAHTPVCDVKLAAALVLERCAEALDDPQASLAALEAAETALAARLDELERDYVLVAGDGVSALNPSFRAQELSFVVSQVAQNVAFAAAADRRSWVERLLGRRPQGLAGPLAAAQERAGAHAERHSVWLQNSVRGAVALGLAVLVAELSGVQHAFWVVLGTLSVLRSNALGTGQNALRGLVGTTVGFAVGAVLVALIGTNTTLLWVLLPPAVLFAGLAPAAISFAAGQAAFTVALLILFNLIAPEGWQIGLVRIEDVALGSGVSLVVGLLVWPRGAAAALDAALADAYADGARYLARAVEFGIGRCDASGGAVEAPAAEAMRAAAASRRLDDAFRGFLAERGEKPVTLAELTTLVTGVAGLRLAGDAVLDLWQGAQDGDGDRAAARAALRARSDVTVGWYDRFAASLIGRAPVPAPLAHDDSADARLLDAVRDDLVAADGRATATAVRMIWTGDHLDAARRLQRSLVGPAQAARVPSA